MDDAILSAQRVIRDAEQARTASAAREIEAVKRKYGVLLRPRIVLDGDRITAGVVIEVDPSWTPEISARKSGSDTAP